MTAREQRLREALLVLMILLPGMEPQKDRADSEGIDVPRGARRVFGPGTNGEPGPSKLTKASDCCLPGALGSAA